MKEVSSFAIYCVSHANFFIIYAVLCIYLSGYSSPSFGSSFHSIQAWEIYNIRCRWNCSIYHQENELWLYFDSIHLTTTWDGYHKTYFMSILRLRLISVSWVVELAASYIWSEWSISILGSGIVTFYMRSDVVWYGMAYPSTTFTPHSFLIMWIQFILFWCH